jgi:hypothetical protein
MNFPIKFNEDFLGNSFFSSLLPRSFNCLPLLQGKASPSQFARSMCALKFARTFKSTAFRRYPLTIDYLSSLDVRFTNIIDIGCSDGSASLDALRRLNFNCYYLTDKNINLYCHELNNAYFVFDSCGIPLLRAGRRLTIYNDSNSPRLLNFFITKLVFLDSLKRLHLNNSLLLINPCILSLQSGNVRILSYDVLRKPFLAKSTLIIAANIFNDSYFSEHELKLAFSNVIKSCLPGALICLIDNRKYESATIFQFRDNKISVKHHIGDGFSLSSFFLECAKETNS